MKNIYSIILAFCFALSLSADNGEPLPEYNPNYLLFDEDNWTLLSFDPINGNGTLEFAGEVPPFIPGQTITTLANDTIGYFLRRIMEVDQDDNILWLQTQVADMEDIFLNKSFVLNSAILPPASPDMHNMTHSEISRAMTSDRGHIHPVEIIYHHGSPNQRRHVEKIDLLDPDNIFNQRSSDTFNVFHVYESWENFELFSAANLEFMLDEGLLSLKADAILAFDFRARPAGDTTIIKDGQLDKITLTIEGEALAKADLSLTASVEYEKEEEEFEIYTDLIYVTQKFFVGPVVVWVTFSLDLLADYYVHAHAELQASWGFEASQTVTIGGSYSPPTNDWEAIFEEEFSYEIKPLEVTGEASVEAKMMIYPRAKLFLYGAAGPYADIVPWAGANFDATAMINTDGETDLKWTANLDLGVDQRIGIKPAWLESLIGQLGPWVDTLYYDRLWEAPHKLGLISKLESSYVLPVTIPLQFRVSDNLDFRTPIAPVFFNADHGELNKEWAISNLGGIATVDWSFDVDNFDQNQEIHTLTASLLDTEDETIHSITVTVNLNTKSTAFYIEGLESSDSIIIENIVFENIQKGVYANNENMSSLRVTETLFENCELAISGFFGSLNVHDNTTFENCQTALHITGNDNTRNQLRVYDTEFSNISLTGIYFTDMYADIRHSSFDNVANAIQGYGGDLRYGYAAVRDTEITESHYALNFTDLDWLFLQNIQITHSGLPDSTSTHTALSAENIVRAEIESINIENYYNAIYGSNFRDPSRIEKASIRNCIRGIDLRNVHRSNIFENLIMLDHAVGPESAMRDSYFGIYLQNSNTNQLARNNLVNLCTAIKQVGCVNNILSANSFWNCQCDETGIRSDASHTKITNNNFEGNAGSALLFEHSTTWAIANNNFIENEYGIRNLTPAITIEGTGNHFTGQTAANTDGNVVTFGDLDQKVSLVADFLPDTLFIPYGMTDSIGLHVQNFVHLNDSVIIDISEELDWVTNDLQHNLALKDSLGGMIYVHFEIPPFDPDLPLPQNAQMVWANLVSVFHESSAADSIIVFVYQQTLDSLYILPEKPTIFIGDSIQFIAKSLDQHGIPIETGIAWLASEGIIAETGWLFPPEDFEGEIWITATDTLSGISALGSVLVTEEWPMLQYIEIHPPLAELKPYQTIKFEALGFNQFGYPYPFFPYWEASGGLIGSDGFYQAPDSTGIYNVMAHSLLNGKTGDALARVRCFTFTDEYHILCGSDSVFIYNDWVKTAGFYNDTIFNPGGCDMVKIWEVVKYESPAVALLLPPVVCENSDAFALTGGTPVGGTYSGTGVDESGWFNPAVSGTGSFEITYTYTDENTCTSSAMATIQVEAIAEVDVSITADETAVCSGETVNFNALALNPGETPVYQWLVNGIEQGDNSPTFSFIPAHNDQVSLILTSSKPCTNNNPATSNIIQITVNPVLSASVEISSTQTEVCEGTEVTISASLQNGGNNPVLQWYVNDMAVGDNNLTFNYSPEDGDVVHAVLLSDLICVEDSPATSNSLDMSVVDNLPVSVSIDTDETLVCEGTEVSFVALPVNPGSEPIYQWQVNGINAGTNEAVFSYIPEHNDVVNVILSSSESCASDNPATSNSITIELIPALEVNASITADANAVCEGEVMTFTAEAANGGDQPSFQWQVNGINSGSDNFVFSHSPADGDEIAVWLTSSEACVTSNPVLSNVITAIVGPPITALVSIEASETTVCIGETVSYSATAVHAGDEPVFQWYVNGTEAGTNSPVFSYIPDDGDNVHVEMVSSAACVTNNPVISNTVLMEVITSLEVEVSITASETSVCDGESVVFTAFGVNGSSNPVYQWQVNGLNAGTNSPTFTYTPANNDQVTVLFTSSESCAMNNPAVSNEIIMQVFPSAIVSVSITADQLEVCDGESVTFTATPINGGTDPHFQWTINGSAAGTNSPVLQYIPDDGDAVGVVLTSNVECAVNNPASSNIIGMTVHPVLEASVEIMSDETTVCDGTAVTFQAIAINAGDEPYFQWLVNGNHIGENSDVFSYVPNDMDEVSLIMTSSENCVVTNPVTSNTIGITVIPSVEVSVSISASATEICEGEVIDFLALPVNGGSTPHFQWLVNGTAAGDNLEVFSYSPVSNDVVTVVLTSSENCAQNNPATAEPIALSVHPVLEVEVSIHTASTQVCEGIMVAYNATTLNGGSNPSYQWKVNGSNAGTNNPVFMYTPLDGDEVSLVFTSSETCVTNNPAVSNTLLMTVIPNVDVDVIIEAETTEVCEGEPVQFTATAINGGTNPAYVWKVNGENTGANSPNFSYVPAHHDLVSVMLISSIGCAANNPAMSDTITLTVNPLPDVSWIHFEPDTLCIFWSPIPLTGGMPEGGFYSGNGVANNVFDPMEAGPGQHIISYHYTSENGCYNMAQYTIFVDYCTQLASHNAWIERFQVYPNPAGQFVIIEISDESLLNEQVQYQLFDVHGKLLRQDELLQVRTSIPLSGIVTETVFIRIYVNGQRTILFKVVKI